LGETGHGGVRCGNLGDVSAGSSIRTGADAGHHWRNRYARGFLSSASREFTSLKRVLSIFDFGESECNRFRVRDSGNPHGSEPEPNFLELSPHFHLVGSRPLGRFGFVDIIGPSIFSTNPLDFFGVPPSWESVIAYDRSKILD
jgi:hypothetical protein